MDEEDYDQKLFNDFRRAVQANLEIAERIRRLTIQQSANAAIEPDAYAQSMQARMLGRERERAAAERQRMENMQREQQAEMERQRLQELQRAAAEIERQRMERMRQQQQAETQRKAAAAAEAEKEQENMKRRRSEEAAEEERRRAMMQEEMRRREQRQKDEDERMQRRKEEEEKVERCPKKEEYDTSCNNLWGEQYTEWVESKSNAKLARLQRELARLPEGNNELANEIKALERTRRRLLAAQHPDTLLRSKDINVRNVAHCTDYLKRCNERITELHDKSKRKSTH